MQARIKKRYFILIFSVFLLLFSSWLVLSVVEIIPNFQKQESFPLFFSGDNSLFLLINAHFVFSIFLLYLIIRHSIKLFIERKRKIPGSIFKRNLFFAFIIFSVIPVMFIFFIAGKLITTSIDNWFKMRIGTGLQNSLVLHREQTKEDRIRLNQAGKQVFAFLSSLGSPGDGESFQDFVAKKVSLLQKNEKRFSLYEIMLWENNGDHFYGSLGQESKKWSEIKRVSTSFIGRLKNDFLGKLRDVFVKSNVGCFDFYGSLYWVKQVQISLYSEPLFLLVVHRYPKNIFLPLINIQNSLDDYSQLRTIKNPIYWNYWLTFLLITLLIVFLSIWCAFFLARGISKPIQELLIAVRKVRQGNLGTRVQIPLQDDLKPLVSGFNEMTDSLQTAYKRLDFQNKEMLMMLEHIKESVFFINNYGRILSFNAAAKKLVEKYLGITRFKNKKINFLGGYVKNLFLSIVRELRKTEKNHFSKEVSFIHVGEERNFLVYVDVIKNVALSEDRDLSRSVEGILVVVDDLSNVYKMNKIKTWQEAAKQIAHEIKNPLTPIQLATQRLQRKLRKHGSKAETSTGGFNPLVDEPVLMDCADTILHQVKIIKDLVAHFSEFARMPDSKIEQLDINSIIEEICALYKMSYPDVTIECDLKKFLPSLKADRKKMKRVFINLLDNSIRALKKQKMHQKESLFSSREEAPLIKIKTSFKTGRNQLEIIVSDNGPGIPKDVFEKLFLPYVSTGSKNMGLGLAIVHDIVTQIGGSIRLLQNSSGAAFQILIPV